MELFERILTKLETPNNASLKMSMKHCHVIGMFSLVVDGDEFGKLTRIFISKKNLKHLRFNSIHIDTQSE